MAQRVECGCFTCIFALLAQLEAVDQDSWCFHQMPKSSERNNASLQMTLFNLIAFL